MLLCRNRRKVDGVGRLDLRLGKCPRDLQQDSAAGSIVRRPVVDVVALHVRIDAQVVVMRGEEYCLLLIRNSRNHSDDIAGIILADSAGDVSLQPYRQFNRFEARFASRIDGFIRVDAYPAEQLARDLHLDPASRLQCRKRIVLQIGFFYRLGVAHYLPAIAGQIGAMNNQYAHGTSARRFLVLVRPAPIVGQGLPFKEFFVLGRRLIDDHQQHFPLHVHALEVVPLILRRLNAIANKDNGRVNVRCRSAGLILGDVILAILQLDRSAILRLQRKAGLILQRVHRQQRNLLEIRAVLACRLKSRQHELSSDILRSYFRSAQPRTPPFQQIVRKKANMGANLFRVNRRSRLACLRRHLGQLGNVTYLGAGKGGAGKHRCDPCERRTREAETKIHFDS